MYRIVVAMAICKNNPNAFDLKKAQGAHYKVLTEETFSFYQRGAVRT